MLAEGIHIYNKIVRVFGSKKYNRVFCVLGWGTEKCFSFFHLTCLFPLRKVWKLWRSAPLPIHSSIYSLSLSLSRSFFLLVLSFRWSSSSRLRFSWCFVSWIRTLQCVSMFFYTVCKAYLRHKNNWQTRGFSNCLESPSGIIHDAIWVEGLSRCYSSPRLSFQWPLSPVKSEKKNNHWRIVLFPALLFQLLVIWEIALDFRCACAIRHCGESFF